MDYHTSSIGRILAGLQRLLTEFPLVALAVQRNPRTTKRAGIRDLRYEHGCPLGRDTSRLSFFSFFLVGC